ncbi:carboxylesterase [Fomitopsis serialis]|uniref:carboxylesterase n=1 Tax=Fomitopsis serialis TaxID=139415 RepID=UPI0020084115|nr:carboxylesterase [Neoantrodia serialis]KAH9917293.1 carboxylesterase [Neoantrodia serialis]
MIAKVPALDLEEPVVLHEDLATTFTGVVHPVSTAEAPVHQYRGIQYASIPARFRQSRLNTIYPLLTDASHYGPICPQPRHPGADAQLFGISEDNIPVQVLKQNELDCLNLNITCPGDATPESRLPVMLWIHGGGNRGSGSKWVYDGGAFVQKSMLIGKPVIMVTFNYRLGLLGFAASPALREDNKAAGDEGVGNYGLRDQRRALEWVYHFISAFGGDPSNITLFGESTGAADILCHLHSAANEKQPLFRRAIVQSANMDLELPTVHTAGWHMSRYMAALHVQSVGELRALEAEKLVALGGSVRAVDDGVFFHKHFSGSLIPEAEQPAEHRRGRPHHPPHSYSHNHLRLLSRSRSRARHTPVSAHHQPLLIGDCSDEALLWARPASNWSATAIERRVRAVCQSLTKASALLRAYDIHPHAPPEELHARVLELINDARFAWPTECVAAHARRERGGRGVYRYVFDQEGPGRAVPHHAVDLVYLFDNVPLPTVASQSPAQLMPEHFDSDSDDEDSPRQLCGEHAYIEVHEHVAVHGHALAPCLASLSALTLDAETDSGASDSDMSTDSGFVDDWGVPVVDDYAYSRVRDAMQARWLAFAWGEAPWAEDKVFVFGPEGETGERSMSIFEGRRRARVWREVLEPLGMQLVQKVGAELANGPVVPVRGHW